MQLSEMNGSLRVKRYMIVYLSTPSNSGLRVVVLEFEIQCTLISLIRGPPNKKGLKGKRYDN